VQAPLQQSRLSRGTLAQPLVARGIRQAAGPPKPAQSDDRESARWLVGSWSPGGADEWSNHPTHEYPRKVQCSEAISWYCQQVAAQLLQLNEVELGYAPSPRAMPSLAAVHRVPTLGPGNNGALRIAACLDTCTGQLLGASGRD
jgi:hypothetical protein